MRVLFLGDTHGNIVWLERILASAQDNDIDAVFIVGDFGYWEHEPDGVAFLDVLQDFTIETGVDIYWLDGNHENHPLLWSRYTDTDDRGFVPIRPNIFYAPRGHRWEWDGIRFMSLGGAASIDKKWRTPGKSWWPEEELTDAQIDKALSDPTPVDILLTHDKPLRSNPQWGRRPVIEALLPNQQKVQRVVDALRPRLLIHGHLHHRYTDDIRVGDNDQFCRVEGLDCDGTDFPDTHLVMDLARVAKDVA